MRTIPVIAADTTAYKFKPEDPGGIEVLHQDRRVGHDIRQGSEVAAAGVKLPGNTLTERNWCSAAPGVSSATRKRSCASQLPYCRDPGAIRWAHVRDGDFALIWIASSKNGNPAIFRKREPTRGHEHQRPSECPRSRDCVRPITSVCLSLSVLVWPCGLPGRRIIGTALL
jgi:hypothetical protein